MKKLPGGQTIDAAAPIGTIPLYVKAGSIVPMGPNIEYATQKPAGAIELRIYPGADGEFTFYEDENDNYNYENGKSSTYSFNWDNKLHQLTISARRGSFEGMIKKRLINIVLVKQGHGVNGEMAEKSDRSLIYAGKAVTVNL